MEAAGSLGKSMRKILGELKVIQHVKNEEILDLDTFPGPRGPLRDPRSRADAQRISHMARRTGSAGLGPEGGRAGPLRVCCASVSCTGLREGFCVNQMFENMRNV